MIEVPDSWRWPGPSRHFGFLVLPGFSMIAFTNAIEPLRMANQLAEGELYRWSVYSLEGGPVIEVTIASRFRSACHLSRAYRAFFGHAPSRERRLARVAFSDLSGDSTAAGGVAT